MRIFKQIFLKITWLLLYIIFNTGLCYLEIKMFFNRKPISYNNNTGVEVLDVLSNVGGVFLNVLSGLAVLGHMCFAATIASVAFLLFIPLHFYVIKRKYSDNKKRFWYGLLTAFGLVIILKLLFHLWEFVVEHYL